MTVFAQVSSHVLHKDEPAQPDTWTEGYAKKSRENAGVIAMIELLIKDVEKEIVEAKTEEKNSQQDYETTMADAAEKRSADAKSITEKRSALADAEMSLQTHSEGKANTGRELLALSSYLTQLHSECDWLLQYYDVRKEARASE